MKKHEVFFEQALQKAENRQSATAVLARADAGGLFSIGRMPDSEKTRSVFERALQKAENRQSATAVLALLITYGGNEHER